jgi:hypothetical protein
MNPFPRCCSSCAIRAIVAWLAREASSDEHAAC